MALTYMPGGVINYTYVDDKRINTLLEEGLAETDRDVIIEKMREVAKIVNENVYDNIMYTQNLFFAHSDDWDGFVAKPSELLSIVNPISVASAHPVG